MLVAHRGASAAAPENTLAAVRAAWEAGADAVEGDFRLTRDGVVVCIHDATTARTADIDLTVAAAPLARLREADVGSGKGRRWAGERIPTIDEVLDAVPADKTILIEIKDGPGLVVPVARALKRALLPPERAVIIAFDPAVIRRAREVMPATRRYWLTGPEGCRTAEALAGFLEKIGADGAGCRVHRGIDRRFAAALRKRGKELNVWTVDRADAARRLAAAGVDSISTNRPGPIGEALEAAGLRKARPGGPGDSGG